MTFREFSQAPLELSLHVPNDLLNFLLSFIDDLLEIWKISTRTLSTKRGEKNNLPMRSAYLFYLQCRAGFQRTPAGLECF